MSQLFVACSALAFQPSAPLMRVAPLPRAAVAPPPALAAALAGEAGCAGLLIALADMPFVPRRHFRSLRARFAQGAPIAVSATHDARMPPAIFDAAHFGDLQRGRGDQGARALLHQGVVVPCPAQWLIDIDTPTALEQAERSPSK